MIKWVKCVEMYVGRMLKCLTLEASVLGVRHCDILLYDAAFDFRKRLAKGEAVLKPKVHYEIGARPEVHLADAFVRVPFGMCSVFGGASYKHLL